jgi:hypothetical protein
MTAGSLTAIDTGLPTVPPAHFHIPPALFVLFSIFGYN